MDSKHDHFEHHHLKHRRCPQRPLASNLFYNVLLLLILLLLLLLFLLLVILLLLLRRKRKIARKGRREKEDEDEDEDEMREDSMLRFPLSSYSSSFSYSTGRPRRKADERRERVACGPQRFHGVLGGSVGFVVVLS